MDNACVPHTVALSTLTHSSQWKVRCLTVELSGRRLVYLTHRQNDAFVMPLHAGMHEGGRTKIPKTTNYEKSTNGGHAAPESLRQMDVPRYNASRNEEVERRQVADGVESLGEELKILVCALVFVS